MDACRAGGNPCLPALGAAEPIYDAIADHGVTHLCGAPIVMSVLIKAKPEEKRAFSHP